MKVNKNLDKLYRGEVNKSKMESQFIRWYDSLITKPIQCYITRQDINTIKRISESPYYHNHPKEMYGELDELMYKREFLLAGGGTNRRAYSHYKDNVVLKTSTDYVGVASNLREYQSQHIIKPFCDKIFEVDCTGVVGLNEKVIPFKTPEEYQKYAEDIFLINWFVFRNNDLAIDDIGCSRYKNWGYRQGFGPVLLDYPSVFKVDENKKLCTKMINGMICCGTLDYDDGFDMITCTSCGARYFPSALAIKDSTIDDIMVSLGRKEKINNKGVKHMAIKVTDNKGNVVFESKFGGSSNHADPTKARGYSEEPSTMVMSNGRLIRLDNNKKSDIKVPKIRVTEAIVNVNDKIDPMTNEIIRTPEFRENGVVTIKDVATTVTAPLTRKDAFIKRYTELNTGFPSVGLSDTDYVKLIRDNCSRNNSLSEEAVGLLYIRVCKATAKANAEFNIKGNIISCDSHINDMLRDIAVAHNTTQINLFAVFDTIVRTIKNSYILFESIANLFESMCQTISFETDEAVDGVVYNISTEYYEQYENIIKNILNIYKTSTIVMKAGFFDSNLIISHINFPMSQVVYAATEDEDDQTRFTQIYIGNMGDFYNKSFDVTTTSVETEEEVVSEEKPEDNCVDDEPVEVETEEETVEVEAEEPVEEKPTESRVFNNINKDCSLTINPNKEMTRNQKNKYDKNKNNYYNKDDDDDNNNNYHGHGKKNKNKNKNNNNRQQYQNNNGKAE